MHYDRYYSHNESEIDTSGNFQIAHSPEATTGKQDKTTGCFLLNFNAYRQVPKETCPRGIP